MPVRLVPTSGGKPVKLDKPVLLFGRNPDCDVILTQSRKVSRQHCLVACVENRVLVRDLESTNGVWINGQRVDREGVLRLGDELAVADMRYHLLKMDGNGDDDRRTMPVSEDEQEQLREAISGRDSDRGRERPKRPTPPREIPPDQEIPVAIPDEEDSFIVEASSPRLPRVKPEADILARLLESDPEIIAPRKEQKRRKDRHQYESDERLPGEDESDEEVMEL